MSVDSPDTGSNAVKPATVLSYPPMSVGALYCKTGRLFVLALDFVKELRQRAVSHDYFTGDWERCDSTAWRLQILLRQLEGPWEGVEIKRKFSHEKASLRVPVIAWPAGFQPVAQCVATVHRILWPLWNHTRLGPRNCLRIAAALATTAETGLAFLWFHPDYREKHWEIVDEAASMAVADDKDWFAADVATFREDAAHCFLSALELANEWETRCQTREDFLSAGPWADREPDFLSPSAKLRWKKQLEADDDWMFLCVRFVKLIGRFWDAWEAWEGIVSPAGFEPVADCLKTVARILRKIQKHAGKCIEETYPEFSAELATAAGTGVGLVCFGADCQERHWRTFVTVVANGFLLGTEEDFEEDECDSCPLKIQHNALASDSAAAGGDRSGQRWTWEQVRDELDTMRFRGERFISYRHAAATIGCTKSLVEKAITNGTVELQQWATKQRGPSRRIVSPDMADVILRNAQGRDPDPAKVLYDCDLDLVLSKLLQKATPDERARIHAMTPAEKRELAEAHYQQIEDEKEQQSRHDKLRGSGKRLRGE